MSEVQSPFPAGTTETVIWVDSDNNVLPGPDGAAGGEVVVRFPDGREEHTLFTTRPA